MIVITWGQVWWRYTPFGCTVLHTFIALVWDWAEVFLKIWLRFLSHHTISISWLAYYALLAVLWYILARWDERLESYWVTPVMGVGMDVGVGMCVHQDFNLTHLPWITIDRIFIFHMSISCHKIFPGVPKLFTQWLGLWSLIYHLPWGLTYFQKPFHGLWLLNLNSYLLFKFTYGCFSKHFLDNTLNESINKTKINDFNNISQFCHHGNHLFIKNRKWKIFIY